MTGTTGEGVSGTQRMLPSEQSVVKIRERAQGSSRGGFRWKRGGTTLGQRVWVMHKAEKVSCLATSSPRKESSRIKAEGEPS